MLEIKPISVSVDGGHLVIRMPLQKPVKSKSGKTFVIASTLGVLTTGAKFSGRNVTIVANAYIKRNESVLKQRARATMARLAGRLK